MKNYRKPVGWRKESYRHSLAAKGVKTYNKAQRKRMTYKQEGPPAHTVGGEAVVQDQLSQHATDANARVLFVRDTQLSTPGNEPFFNNSNMVQGPQKISHVIGIHDDISAGVNPGTGTQKKKTKKQTPSELPGLLVIDEMAGVGSPGSGQPRAGYGVSQQALETLGHVNRTNYPQKRRRR